MVNKSVLIVEDDAIDMYVAEVKINRILEPRILIKAYSAAEASIRLDDHYKNYGCYPDILFVDLYMPICSGIDFIRELKMNKRFSERTKIYAITASLDSSRAQKALEKLGIKTEEVIIKPLSEKKLKAIFF